MHTAHTQVPQAHKYVPMAYACSIVVHEDTEPAARRDVTTSPAMQLPRSALPSPLVPAQPNDHYHDKKQSEPAAASPSRVLGMRAANLFPSSPSKPLSGTSEKTQRNNSRHNHMQKQLLTYSYPGSSSSAVKLFGTSVKSARALAYGTIAENMAEVKRNPSGRGYGSKAIKVRIIEGPESYTVDVCNFKKGSCSRELV